ncbi:MAG: class I SAM-dependent methyltransferase [Chloroflexi bacterium]|nr:class I SAM-dependent methyltransferase [Chloroflexota bacterium]
MSDLGGTTSPSQDAWKKDEHARYFGTWDHLSTATLVKICDQFNECQLFRTLADSKPSGSLSDVGCATGRFFRYFKKIAPGLEYKGFDISEAAIQYAKGLYPAGNFTRFDGDVKSTPDIRSDIVFCRDVVIHQENPSEFLSDLYDATKSYLILRVRTRETGSTVFDTAQSCQYVYGQWVPYMVYNTAELIDLIRSFEPSPAKITLWRFPLVLGGENGRFVPKELYYPETGTAESALLIEKRADGAAGETVVNIETHPETRGNELPGWARALRQVARRLRV